MKLLVAPGGSGMFAFATSERFSRLAPRDRDRLEALCKLDWFPAGAEIQGGGKPAGWLYLIVDGAVDVRLRTPRGEVTLSELRPGDLFGELETFADLPAALAHVARKETVVRALPKDPLKQELRAHRSLATGLLGVYCRSMSEKLRAASEVAAHLGVVSQPPAAPTTASAPSGAGSPVLASGDAAQTSLAHPPHLGPEDSAWLSVLGQQIDVAAGAAVVKEGDRSRSFYLVDRGLLEVRKRIAGQELPIARLSAQDLFGFMSFVDGRPRSASVVALEESALTRVDPDSLDRAMGLNFTVSFKFLGTLCGVLGRTFRETAEKILALR